MSGPWNPTALNLAVVLPIVAAGAALLAMRRWSWGAYTLAGLLLPLSTGSLQSMARYAVVIFPLFAGWPWPDGDRASSAERVIVGTSVALVAWLVAFFTLRVDFALA